MHGHMNVKTDYFTYIEMWVGNFCTPVLSLDRDINCGSMRCELQIYTTQIHNSTIIQQFNTIVIIIIQNDNERMAALT